ncbi:hypothetical protein DUNSADRAFT_8165, partial [Dunaliella salina]
MLSCLLQLFISFNPNHAYIYTEAMQLLGMICLVQSKHFTFHCPFQYTWQQCLKLMDGYLGAVQLRRPFFLWSVSYYCLKKVEHAEHTQAHSCEHAF